MSSVRSATYAAYRVPNCHAGRSPRAAGPPFHVGRGSPGQSALPPPKGWLAHTPHSSHRADSPRVYLAALALPYHRPCRMIAGPGRTHPATMAREPLPQTRCLRRSLDPAVGRLPKDGRYRIAAELPELVQGGHGPAGDEHRLALAGLIGFAPVDEQPAGAVVSPFDVGRNESGHSLRTAAPWRAGSWRRWGGCSDPGPSGGHQGRGPSDFAGGPDVETAVRTTGLLTAERNPWD